MAIPHNARERTRAFLRIDHGLAACWWRTSFPSLTLLLVTCAFVITKTGRDALYFQQGGLFDLPKVYLFVMVLSVPAATGTLWLMRRVGPRPARVAALMLIAALQVGFHAVAQPGGGWLMTSIFTLVPVLYGVMLSLVWLLGGELLEYTPRYIIARLYSTLGASSMLGGLAGAMGARRLAGHLPPESFFLIGAGMLVLAAVVVGVTYRVYPCEGMPKENPGPVPAPAMCSAEDLRCVAEALRRPYLVFLALVGTLASLAGVLVEFLFYWGASDAARDSRQSLMFFANFYIALNAAALLVQVLAMPVLQRRIGVHGSLMVLPAALTGASAWVAAGATALTRGVLRVTEGGLKSSIHRSNWEQAYLPLQRAHRALAKLMVDGVASRSGEAAAALLLLWWIDELSRGGVTAAVLSARITYVLLAACLAWMILTVALRRSRRDPSLLPDTPDEYRADLPLPDG